MPWTGPIVDAHVHIAHLASARQLMDVAELFGVTQLWSQTPLEQVDDIRQALGDRIRFVAIPDYRAPDKEKAFGVDWLERIEAFACKGAKLVKFWAAPRGRDITPMLRLDHPIRWQAMKLARALKMDFMVHVADPDTWFATKYRDRTQYGTKAEQYEPLIRALEEFADVRWLAAHMAGDPEHLDHLNDLLTRYPHLYLDTSATKWMVRELSYRTHDFAQLCRDHPGRILFGSDIVAPPPLSPPVSPPIPCTSPLTHGDMTFDHYASRYWALRTLLETDYHGSSPIVDPDLPMVDPSLPPTATAHLRGARLDAATLDSIYRTASANLSCR